jgi:hypothetical protein
MFIRLSSFLFSFLFFNQFSFSQTHNHLNCGSHLLDTEDYTEFVQFYSDKLANNLKSAGDTLYLPIALHVCANTDGSNMAMGLSDAVMRICEMNTHYKSAKMQFYIKKLDIIKNTNINSPTSTVNQGTLAASYKTASSINVFIVKLASASGIAVCGYYSPTVGSSLDHVIVETGCMQSGSTTLSHEVGHFFSLRHTFYGWEGQTTSSTGNASSTKEKVDRTNCTTAGDGLCDTSPDYLFSRWTCDANGRSPALVNFGTIQVKLQDANGATFTANGKNFMSYSNDYCMTEFSADQTAKMKSQIATFSSRIALTTQTPAIKDSIYQNISFVAPVNAFDTFEVYNDVTLRWKKSSNTSAYIIKLCRTFPAGGSCLNTILETMVTDSFLNVTNLATNTNYIISVYPFNGYDLCRNNKKTIIFHTGETVANVENAQQAAILENPYPNPVASGATITLNIVNQPESVSLVNANGTVIKLDSRLQINDTQLSIDTQALSSGVYYIISRIGVAQSYHKIFIY